MNKEPFSFAKAYEEIERINEWFQKTDIDLDQALEKYKRGMELVRLCAARLKEAENKFEEVKKEYETM